MTPVIPPQGFRHAVDLLLKNRARKFPVDVEGIAASLLALGDDMKAPPEFAAWVISEYERVYERPAPATLAEFGRRVSQARQRRDLFVIYVPEDRLPIAAPLAVELVKRRITVAFSEYEVESDAQLASALTHGLSANLAGAVLVTPAFLRRKLAEPAPSPRLKILEQPTPSTAQVEALMSWLSKINTQKDDFRT